MNNDFLIERISEGRGRYRSTTHVLHLAPKCKQMKPRSKRESLSESVWFYSGSGHFNWGDKPKYVFYNDRFNYQPPKVCEWCMNDLTYAKARTLFWVHSIASGVAKKQALTDAYWDHVKKWADGLEKIHPYTPLLKAVREAWIDGDTAPNPDPRYSYNRRGVTWKYGRDQWFSKWGEDSILFSLSNIHWSDVLRIKVVFEGDGVRVDDINHSTAAITEPNDARRLAAVFDVIENWKKEQGA